jgi:hypothetical protein
LNIFYLDKDPELAAQMMVDVHVRSKMIVECAQIISNCYSLKELEKAPLSQKGSFRKHSYPKHPCCLWIKESLSNLCWVIEHGKALIKERIYRWPNSPHHFSGDFINWAAENHPDNMVEDYLKYLTITKPALAFGKEWEYLKCSDPVESYRRYYNVAKRQSIKMTWTNRQAPEWYHE